jgi:hypothetical protein
MLFNNKESVNVELTVILMALGVGLSFASYALVSEKLSFISWLGISLLIIEIGLLIFSSSKPKKERYSQLAVERNF